MDFKFLKDREEYLKILEKIDRMFPIALSDKIPLEILAEKAVDKGNILCCYVDGVFAGQVAFYCNDFKTKNGYISTLAVLNDFQGKGIAKQLIEKAIAFCKKGGMETVTLYAHSTNTVAVKMYKSLGFCEVPSDRDGDIKFSLEI